uniref:Uncharacterized protein n=1 Tax=Opuntia streptacantha TaxID=393608 RepID=A0A7C9A7K6_OPUST
MSSTDGDCKTTLPIMRLVGTLYEKVKSVLDQVRTSDSYEKDSFPTRRFCSFRGWLTVLHKTSVPSSGCTVSCIFSFFGIFLLAGVTYSGKLNGTHRENSPS